jgi:cell division septal protein FtsQ
MPSYSDVQRAVRVEKVRIWFAWVSASVIALIVGRAVAGLGTAGTVVQLLLAVAWLALTVAAVRMTGALNRRAERARREVLGDDYPG